MANEVVYITLYYSERIVKMIFGLIKASTTVYKKGGQLHNRLVSSFTRIPYAKNCENRLLAGPILLHYPKNKRTHK